MKQEAERMSAAGFPNGNKTLVVPARYFYQEKT
jgi:hypothetical protein